MENASQRARVLPGGLGLMLPGLGKPMESGPLQLNALLGRKVLWAEAVTEDYIWKDTSAHIFRIPLHPGHYDMGSFPPWQ